MPSVCDFIGGSVDDDTAVTMRGQHSVSDGVCPSHGKIDRSVYACAGEYVQKGADDMSSRTASDGTFQHSVSSVCDSIGDSVVGDTSVTMRGHSWPPTRTGAFVDGDGRIAELPYSWILFGQSDDNVSTGNASGPDTRGVDFCAGDPESKAGGLCSILNGLLVTIPKNVLSRSPCYFALGVRALVGIT